MPSPKPKGPPTLSVVSISLDPAHRRALATLCRLTGRTAQSLLREGLDFVLSRYVPVEIKAPPAGGARKRGAERRARRRVPTLTDSIDSPASGAARAVRDAYVAASLAPSDPSAMALIEAAVAAAARHGFVVKRRPPASAPAAQRPRRPKGAAR